MLTGPRETGRRSGLSNGAVCRDPRRAGRAHLELSDGPRLLVTAQFDGNILERPPAECDLIGTGFDLRRKRHHRQRRHQRPQRGKQPQRFGVCCASGQQTVRIELPRRQREMQQRRCTKADIAATVSLSALSSGPYAASTCSNAAADGLAFTRDVIRHGCPGTADLASAGRASVSPPSKFGTALSNVSTPSRSASSGRSPGSGDEAHARALAVAALTR